MCKNNPYINDKQPQFLPSIVCYIDILGYSSHSLNAIDSGKANEFLGKIYKTLHCAYKRVDLWNYDFLCNSSFYRKVFTDNIVFGFPSILINHVSFDLFQVLDNLSEYQVGLAMSGFLVRGGVTFGKHFMDDDVVFGPAFLKAYNHDKKGGAPRISFDDSAMKWICGQVDHYQQPDKIRLLNQHFLRDTDGTLYLNYLAAVFTPDPCNFTKIFIHHRNIIKHGLEEYSHDPYTRVKYEWAAKYHNYICNEYANNPPILRNANNEICNLPHEQAKKLLRYLINIESLATTPSQINIESLEFE